MNPSDPFGDAIAWIINVMLGEMATAVAAIAVAGMGSAMLQGRQLACDGEEFRTSSGDEFRGHNTK